MKTHIKKQTLSTVAIIGGGSWATAIVKILSENDTKINWWLRNEADVNYIKQFGHNPHYLSDVQINLRKVKVWADISKTLEGVQYVILAVPAAFVQDALRNLSPLHLASKVIISAIKGMIPDKN